MRYRKQLIIIAFTVLGTLALGPSVGFSAEPCIPCGDLLTIDFGPEVTITSAEVRSEITDFDMFGNPISIPVPGRFANLSVS